MSVDNCIITKYTLSEREKELKRAFFLKKSHNSNSLENKQIQKFPKPEKSNFNLPENDEMINKLIEQNLHELRTYEANLKEKKNFTIDNYQNQIPLNLVYSQNKILEKNVDILHETQRSLHDLLIYNLHKDKQNLSKHSSHQDQKMIFDLISPLLIKFEELKTSLTQIQSQISANASNKNTNQQDKIKELEMKHNQFKEQSQKFEKSVESIQQNKQFHKDIQILKAIEELKNSVSQINSEMNKMENEFSLNIKKIVEENKFKNLLNGVNNSVNDTVSKLNSFGNAKNLQKKNFDSLDYVDYHKELLDINLRKEELLLEFKSRKFEIPDLSKIVTPKEKIEFSYKLDLKDENNYDNNISDKSTKMMNSATLSERESDNEKSGKNIFLNNLSHSVKTGKNSKKNEENNEKCSNKNVPSKINQIRQENLHLIKTKSKSKEKQKILQTNQSENQIYIQENSEKYLNHINNSDSNSPIENKPEMNIIDRMKECKEKMKNYKSNPSPERSESIPALSINANYSTKNNTSNVSSEPSSSKYLKSSFVLKSINQKLDTIKDEEIAVKEKQDAISIQLKQVENDMSNKNKADPLRKEIKSPEVTSLEKTKSHAVHDLVLKLCVEKILQEKNKFEIEKNEKKVCYVEKPQSLNENILPYDYEKSHFKQIVENQLVETIKNMLRTKRKFNQADQYSLHEKTEEKNEMNKSYNHSMIDKLKEENEKRENDIQNYLKDILNRFEVIEKSIPSKTFYEKKENNMIKEDLSNLNLDDMVNKITEKIKGNMQINIHVSNPLQEKKDSQANILQTHKQSFQIEASKQEKDKRLNDVSTYSHPFANSKQVDFQELERDIPLPYMFNLNEYEVSSATDLEISQTKRSYQTKNHSNIRETIQNKDESFSEGQLNNSKTDQDTSRNITNMTNITNQADLYGDHIRIIQNINEKISNRREFKSEEENSEYNHEPKDSYKDEYQGDDAYEESNSSSIEINVNKHIVNINDNDILKKYNLYNSEEFNKFQKNFRGNLRESPNQNQMTGRMSDKGLGYNSFRFINFKNNSVDKEIARHKDQNVINNYNTMNPNVLSFGNFISNKSSQQSNNFNSNSAKLIKISNEEIEDLIRRQNEVNNKLKIIARNANENNTITENNSELTTLKQMAESSSFQHDRKYSKEKLNYKTDESSYIESYRNYSENFN